MLAVKFVRNFPLYENYQRRLCGARKFIKVATQRHATAGVDSITTSSRIQIDATYSLPIKFSHGSWNYPFSYRGLESRHVYSKSSKTKEKCSGITNMSFNFGHRLQDCYYNRSPNTNHADILSCDCNVGQDEYNQTRKFSHRYNPLMSNQMPVIINPFKMLNYAPLQFCRNFTTQSTKLGENPVPENTLLNESITKTQVLYNTHATGKKIDESGAMDFLTFIMKSNVWADKSLLIKEITKFTSEVVLITCPRKWGKSLNLSMLRYFYDKSLPSNEAQIAKKFFQDGSFTTQENVTVKMNGKPLIGHDVEFMKAHLHQHPVIYMDFRSIRNKTYLEDFRTIMARVYKHHSSLLRSWNGILQDNTASFEDKTIAECNIERFKAILNRRSDESELTNSIKTLSQWLCEVHRKPTLVFIDEFDALQNSILFDESVMSNEPPAESLNFMREVMDTTFKDCAESCIEKAVITGILRVAKSTMFGGRGLNNVLIDLGMVKLNTLAPFYGFSENEVELMMKHAGIHSAEAMEDVKRWYDGYKTIDSNNEVFCPWSIMRYCQDKDLSAHWNLSGSLRPVKRLLKHRFVYDILFKLAVKNETSIFSSEELMKLNVSIYHNLYKLIRSPPSYDNFSKDGMKSSILLEIEGNIPDVRSGLVAMLWQAGYLSVKKYHESSDTIEIGVPNLEIRRELKKIVRSRLDKQFMISLNRNQEYIMQSSKCAASFYDWFKTNENGSNEFKTMVYDLQTLFNISGKLYPFSDLDLLLMKSSKESVEFLNEDAVLQIFSPVISEAKRMNTGASLLGQYCKEVDFDGIVEKQRVDLMLFHEERIVFIELKCDEAWTEEKVMNQAKSYTVLLKPKESQPPQFSMALYLGINCINGKLVMSEDHMRRSDALALIDELKKKGPLPR